MDAKIEKMANEKAAQNYAVEFLEEKGQEEGFSVMAYNPELPGCMAQGTSKEDALNNLRDARFDYICSLLEDGIAVPLPMQELSTTTTDLTSSESSNTVVSIMRSVNLNMGFEDTKQNIQVLVLTSLPN